MKKISLLTFLLFSLFISLISEQKTSLLATITEVQGTVEIKRQDNWKELKPLQPLYARDVIRVGKGGRAVLLYLGNSTITITNTNSPYSIEEKKIGESRSKKILIKIKKIILSLIRKDEEKSVVLVTRTYTDRIKVIQPEKTSILFPMDFITFQWEKSDPPYYFKIYQKSNGKEEKKIHEREVNEITLKVPITIFQENVIYNWVVLSNEKRGCGTFDILEKQKTNSILSALTEMLKEIPKENQVTRILIQFGFFIDKELYYDAHQIIDAALEEYPENETMNKLKSLY